MIKAVLLDFDGTIVYEDILSTLAGVNGKQAESIKINEEFFNGTRPGLSGLIERINFLQGITAEQIKDILDKDNFLMPGAREFFAFLRSKHMISIVASGSILPILHYYQSIIPIDYVIGPQPRMNGKTIIGIAEEDFPHDDFKLFESKKILEELHISAQETIAIGDSPGDKSRFLFAYKSITINPKGGIEKYADYIIMDDLSLCIPLINQLVEVEA